MLAGLTYNTLTHQLWWTGTIVAHTSLIVDALELQILMGVWGERPNGCYGMLC